MVKLDLFWGLVAASPSRRSAMGGTPQDDALFVGGDELISG